MADYGIAATVVPPKLDFLGTLGNAQDLKAKMLNNRLLGQQVSGQESLGRIIGANTGPDGVTNYPGASAAAAQDPNAALLLPKFQAEALTRQVQEQKLTQEQLATSHAKLSAVSDTAYSLLSNADKVPLTPDNVLAGVQNLFSQGILTDADKPMAAGFIGRLSQDPAQNAVVLKQLYMQTHPSSEGMEALKGHMTQTDTGPTSVISRTSGLPAAVGGGTEVVGALPMGLSPSVANTPAYRYTDPKTGQDHIVTQAEAARAAAMGGSGAPPPGITSGLPLGTAGTADQGVQFRGNLAHAANQWGNVHANLSNFGNLVDQIASGPKAGAIKALGQIAAQFGLPAPVSKSDTAALEEAGKLGYMIAQQQFQDLGGTGTDSKLDSAMHTSPSEFLSAEGNKRILPLLQGNNDAKKAQQDAYEVWAQTHGPQEYTDFVRQWQQRFDPRVFQAAYMKAADVTAMRNGMDKTERANFDSFQAFAKKRGWLHGGK